MSTFIHLEKVKSDNTNEMKLFEERGNNGMHLAAAYKHLVGIKPTDVESERAFPASSGYIQGVSIFLETGCI
jgi:hypothetical protein